MEQCTSRAEWYSVVMATVCSALLETEYQSLISKSKPWLTLKAATIYMLLLSNKSCTFPFENQKNIYCFAVSPDGVLMISVDEGNGDSYCHELFSSLSPFPFLSLLQRAEQY